MNQLEHKWRFRWNHAVKFEPMDGPEDRRQIETLTPVADHPIHLHHTGKNRPVRKMAVEINQVARRGELEYGTLRGFLNQPPAWFCRTRRSATEQGGQLGIGRFALGVDWKCIEITPDPRQTGRLDGFLEQIAERSICSEFACAGQLTPPSVR